MGHKSVIKGNILLLTLLSFAAHAAAAAMILYTPYDVVRKSMAGHHDRVIWGYVEGNSMPARAITSDNENPADHLKTVSASQKVSGHKGTEQDMYDRKTEHEDVFPGEIQKSPPPFIAAENGHSNEISKSKDSINGLADVPDEGEGEKCKTLQDCGTGNAADGIADSSEYDINALAEFVRGEIERHKYYPEIAKSRGIEGTVYINLYLRQDGRLSGISIARSSGSQILDNAGIKTVRMAGNISSLQMELRELDIVVPITYKLGE